MRLTESIYVKLKESESNVATESIIDFIKSKYGFDIKHFRGSLKYYPGKTVQGLPEYIITYLNLAKEIGLNVDTIEFGNPGVGDNYVGDSVSKIDITDNAINGEPLLRKWICGPGDSYDEYKVEYTANWFFETDDFKISDIYDGTGGNIFYTSDDDEWSMQGIKDEDVAVYYLGTNYKAGLSVLKDDYPERALNALNESKYSDVEETDPVLDKTIKVYDINAFIDKEINPDSDVQYKAFDFDGGAAIIVKSDGSGIIADYEGVGYSFNSTSEEKTIYICPKDGDDGNGHRTISVMATASFKATIDELMQAPSKEMKVKDFFYKWNYNDRCAQNFENIKPYLTENSLNEYNIEGNTIKMKDCKNDVDAIMAYEGETLVLEDMDDYERMMNIVKGLASSQGSYGRLYQQMEEYLDSDEFEFPIYM